jgi:hypothetical protein
MKKENRSSSRVGIGGGSNHCPIYFHIKSRNDKPFSPFKLIIVGKRRSFQPW